MKYLIISIIFFYFFSYNSFAQEEKYSLSDDSLVNYHAGMKKIYNATPVGHRPKIDGILDDHCWQHEGSWQGGFVQREPRQGREPSQKTEIKILYDHTSLYVAIICHDNEPEKMQPILGRRDAIVGDMAGIAFDSYFDRKTAFEFNLSAAGQKLDLFMYGEFGADFNWDAVWDGKTSVGDSAWFAEMRIPFSQLRYANKEEHIWGLHVWRWIYRLKEEDNWKLIPLDAPSAVYLFGELHGLKNISNKRNFELLPFAKAKYLSDAVNNPALGFGLDGKIGVTSDFTLDYTINPDFGQVEADPSILNLTSYEVYYDEKRPFFLEGNKMLEYKAGTDMLFYSRRIGTISEYQPDVNEGEKLYRPEQTSILNALKLTGKNHSGLSLGIINSMTPRENATIYFNDSKRREAVEPFTNYFIGRVKQDFNSGSTVLGGIVTSTIRNIKDEHLKFMPDNSLAGGIDFEHNWLNRKYFIDSKLLLSRVSGTEEAISFLQQNPRHYFQRPDAPHLAFDESMTSMQGWGGEIKGGKRSGKLRATGSLDWRSPGVEFNDLGYLRQADYIDQKMNVVYWVSKPKGILHSYYFEAEQLHRRNFGNELLGDQLKANARFQFKNLWTLELDAEHIFYDIDTRKLWGGPALRIDGQFAGKASFQTNSSKDLFLQGDFGLIRNEDRITRSDEYSFTVKWQPGNRFNISTINSYHKETDNNQYVINTLVNNKKEYIVGKVDRQTISFTFRAELYVTPELSFQYYGNPYASVGKYSNFRKVHDAVSKDIDRRFAPLEIVSLNGEEFLTDEHQNHLLSLNDHNPDFNFQEFRSNFVARWEYKTGSVIYLVWTNTRSHYENMYEPSVIDSFSGISKVSASNALMVKASYWFSL